MNRLSAMPIKFGAMALMLLMAATRFDHFGSVIALPDASLAVFFLAGLWFANRKLLLVLLVEAVFIDYVAIQQLGVSDFCISSAYGFLLGAYVLLWSAGTLSQRYQQLTLPNKVKQLTLLIVAVSLAFAMSNGSFFLLSDNIVERSWTVYMAQFARYYSAYVNAALVYAVLIIAVAHSVHWLLADSAERPIKAN